MDRNPDSDDVSDVLDTHLTLKHSSDDIIFNDTDDANPAESSDDVIFYDDSDDSIFNNSDEDDAMPNVFETPVTLKHDKSKCNRIIPSLKT